MQAEISAHESSAGFRESLNADWNLHQQMDWNLKSFKVYQREKNLMFVIEKAQWAFLAFRKKSHLPELTGQEVHGKKILEICTAFFYTGDNKVDSVFDSLFFSAAESRSVRLLSFFAAISRAIDQDVGRPDIKADKLILTRALGKLD